MKIVTRRVGGTLAAFLVLGLSIALVRPSVTTRAAIVVNDTPIVHQASATNAAPSAPVNPDPELFGLPQVFVIGVFIATILVLVFMAVMLVVRARRRRRW